MVKHKQQKTRPAHNFTKKVGGRNSTPFMSCWNCGLIRLRNEATDRAVARGCVEDAEPVNVKD